MKKKSLFRRVLPWATVGLIALALAVLPAIARSNAEEKAAADILSAQASTGTITATLGGGGALSDEKAVEVTVPSGVEITRFLVSNSELLQEGDPIAEVDRVTVMAAITDVQETLNKLAADLQELSNKNAYSTVSSSAFGRVKAIFAEPGDSAEDVMLRHGALAIVSLDGLMQVKVDSDIPVTVGQRVSVHVSDGKEYSGKIAGSLEGTITVTLPDDGPLYGDTAVVSMEDGTVLGSGSLDVHSPWRALASSGTVASVSARIERKVYNGQTLFTLKDLSNDPAALKLSAQHRKYSEMMQELFLLYQDGTVNAPCDGYVTGIDKTMAKALAAKQQYKVKLLANEKSDDTEKDYVYYVGLVTKVEGDTLTVTMPPFSVPGPEEAAMMSALAMSNSLANFQNSVTMTKPESLEEEVAPNSVYVFVYLNNEEDETKTLEKMVFVTKQEPTPTPVIPIPVIPDISGLIGGQGSGAAAAQQDEGLFPMEGTKVCTVTPTDTMTVTIKVDELDILQYVLGMEADISVDALPGNTYTGTVTAIGGIGTNEGGNSKFDVELTLDREADMLNGMNASVVVKKSTRSALLIPIAALNDSGSKTTVYTAYDQKSGQLLAPVEVTCGISDGENVEILSGLEEGQPIWYSYYSDSE